MVLFEENCLAREGKTGFLLIMANGYQLIEKNMDCRFLKVNIDTVGSKIIYKG